MTIFDSIKLFLLILGTSLLCFILFDLFVMKAFNKHFSKYFADGYEKAVEDMTMRGYFFDSDGNIQYVFVEKRENIGVDITLEEV